MAKKTLINFHAHSTGSDSKRAPEEVVNEAIASGINYLCFTDHYKTPKGVYNEKHEFHSPDYVKEVRRLQEKYKDKIDISFGMEMDWLENYAGWIKEELKKQNYDYVIGSVHLLTLGKKYFAIIFGRGDKEKWKETAEKFGGAENLVKEYYRQTRALAESGLFDAVGHFDTIKMYNKQQDLFSMESEWYRNEVIQTLDAIAKAKICIELNLRGLIKVTEEQYPSLWILKETKKRNIPITIGTDCHSAGEVGLNLEKGYELAKQAGYDSIVRFKNRKRFVIKI